MKLKLTSQNHKFTVLAVASVLATAGLSSTVHAATTIWITDSQGRIGTVASDTGVSTVIGNAGVVLTDIAFDPNGNLWGIDTTQLYTINTGTGVATSVGSFGSGHTFMNGLTFASNGTLYASGTDVVSGQLYDGLFTINTTTGVSTPLNNGIGVSGFSSAGDLAFDLGVLYLSVTDGTTSALISVDPVTGFGTPIGQMAADPNVYGLVHGDDGQVYAVDGTKVYSVNTGNAALTFTSNYGGVVLTAANGAAARTESGAGLVPEPASMALLGLAGIASLRRRR